MALFGLKKDKKDIQASESKKAMVSAESLNGNVTVSTLKRPLVSEKALGLEARGEYVFQVSDEATKPEIKKEIEKLYGVKVIRVNVLVNKPKVKLFRGRTNYKTGFKKALVKLRSGYKIEILPK